MPAQSAGERRQAEEHLRELERRSENRRVSAYWLALIHAGLGESRKAVAWLEKARDDRDVWLVWLGVEPRFDQLRAEGRLDSILASMRLGHLPKL